MQHNRVPMRPLQPLGIELIQQNVVVRRKRRIVQPLRLHAQHDNDVRVLQRFLHLVNAPNRHARRDFLQLPRHPHRRPAQREPAAEFPQQVNVRTRHAAVQNVAQNRHVQVFDRPQPVANRKRVQQSLRWVLVSAVARVHHWSV